jgi:hypothetical protein
MVFEHDLRALLLQLYGLLAKVTGGNHPRRHRFRAQTVTICRSHVAELSLKGGDSTLFVLHLGAISSAVAR